MIAKVGGLPGSLQFRHLPSDFWQKQMPQLPPILMGITSLIWNIPLYGILCQHKISVVRKSSTLPGCLKTWFWTWEKYLEIWAYYTSNNWFFWKVQPTPSTHVPILSICGLKIIFWLMLPHPYAKWLMWHLSHVTLVETVHPLPYSISIPSSILVSNSTQGCFYKQLYSSSDTVGAPQLNLWGWPLCQVKSHLLYLILFIINEDDHCISVPVCSYPVR